MGEKEIVIFREILIKELVTEESKQRKLDGCNAEIMEIGRQLAEHRERKNKALTEVSLRGAEKAQLERFRSQFDAETARLNVRRDELLMRIEEISRQEVGSQMPIGSVEGPHTLRVGDELAAATQACILLQDGRVIDIIE